jgi:riboflavin kinase/FMN adenylyltransferase
MIGRTIGVPTANMRPQEGKVMPKGGVYRTSVELDGVTYKAITNIGTKPTIASNNELLFETHILDYAGDLYGKELTVKFHEFVRGEKKFSSLDELKDEILKNIEDYRNMA